MKSQLQLWMVVSTLILAAAAPSVQAVPTLKDMTSLGSEEWINGALFQTVDKRSTGTGTIQSFVRISKANLDTVRGYNTDGRPLEFQENSSPQFTRQLPLGMVPIVAQTDPGGTTANYYEFLLDINENLSDPDWFLSLDKVEIAVRTAPNELGYSTIFSTLVYDLDGAGDVRIKLNAQINSGSGSGDMVAYIPTSLFPSDPTGKFVYLYSLFGEDGEFPNDDGFEEWAVQTEAELPLIPAPGAAVLGGMGAGLVGWMRRRKTL